MIKGDGIKTTTEIIDTADALVNKVDASEFQKAYNYMDSCLLKNPELYDDATFKQKYDRLKTITKIK